MTLDQIETVLENATEAELDVVEELMSGLGNVFKGARDGIKRGAQAVGGAIQGAGQAVAGAARGAGRAVKAGTQQVGQNVKNMYQTGEAEKAAQQRVEQIKQYITGLEQLLAQHAASGASGRGLDPAKIKTYTLGQLLKVINQKAYTTGKAAAGARDNGFFGGVGGAATSAYKNG
jgi:phage-related protein